MVNLSSGEDSAEGGGMFTAENFINDSDLPTAFDESLNIKLQTTNESLDNLGATLEDHVISIDSNNLDDMSKKADIDAIESNNKAKDLEAAEFDSEIMSIIGSINSRASMLKNKFKIGNQKEKFTTPKPEKRREEPVDPLANIGLDLTLEVEDDDSDDGH